jgi:hypothetical protein
MNRPAYFSEADLPVLAAAVVFVVVMFAGANLLNDPDTYWHLATGEWILANGFPHADPFSSTYAGEPWIAKEWLSQFLYAMVYRLGGWAAIAVLAAASFAMSFALLARALQRNLAPIPVLVCLSVAFALAAPHALARPHLLAMPVMIAWVAGLAHSLDRNRAPPFALLPLMVLWANLHGSFLLGVLLVCAAGLEAVVSAERTLRVRAFVAWGLFGLATLAAACLTPYGPGTALAALDVLQLGELLSFVIEFRPPDFSQPSALEVVLLASVGFASWFGVKLPAVRILVLLGLIHLSLSGVRYAETLGLLAPLYLAAPLTRQFTRLRTDDVAGRPHVLSGIMATVLVTAATIAFANSRPSPDPGITPAAAVEALRSSYAGPILNDYEFGGYMIFTGIAPFVDGRAELYGSPFVLRFRQAVTLANPPALEELLADHRIGATLLSPTTPAVAWLDRDPNWKRLYSDDIAVVHTRLEEPPTRQ